MHEPHPQYGHPPVPPPRHRPNYGLLAAVAAGAVLVALVGIASTVTDDEPAGAAAAATPTGAPVPPYRIVDTASKGLSTDITVEVEQLPSKGGLERVFDDVRRKHDGDGGYFVVINCSSGGTAASDNRLAFGRYSVGNKGQAATGLEDGGTDFQTFPDRECPAG